MGLGIENFWAWAFSPSGFRVLGLRVQGCGSGLVAKDPIPQKAMHQQVLIQAIELLLSSELQAVSRSALPGGLARRSFLELLKL